MSDSPMPVRVFGLAIALLISGVRPAAGNEPDQVYLTQLRSRARQLQLAQSQVWLKLGHWRSRLLGGWHGEADSNSFYLAPGGRDDPAAELDATLAALLAPLPVTATTGEAASAATADALATLPDPGRTHAQCRFPARLLYLAAMLEIDPERVHVQPCASFARFWQRMAARGVTLVFSGYHVQAPASAFGHTLLRLDKADDPARPLELLDQSIDFSAEVDTGNALLYALKGLAGLFPGRFHALPFYYKVREYNDFESRDLWLYRLDLPADRVAFLVAHLWELGWTHFDYYYLSENCSYHVLGALEVVWPHARLLDRVTWPTLPADTVRAARQAGLVRSVAFRPSLRRQVNTRIADLSDSEQQAVADLAEDPRAALPTAPERAARVLDAAVDLIDLRFAREVLTDADTPATRRRHQILARRADLAVPSEPLVVTTPERERPDLGHASARVAMGGGVAQGGKPYGHLDLRLALHDWSDPPRGYPELALLEFASGRIRIDGFRPRLERLDLVHAALLAPMSRFSAHPSWEFRFGAVEHATPGCVVCTAAAVGVGGGATLAAAGDRAAVWTLAWSEAQAGPGWSLGVLPVGVGVGVRGGLPLRWSDEVVSLVQAQGLYWPWQGSPIRLRADGVTRWQAAEHWALAAEAVWADAVWRTGAVVAAYF